MGRWSLRVVALCPLLSLACSGAPAARADATGSSIIDAPAAAADAASRDAAAPPDPMPIKSVVVIVKENHSFDNYFQGFPGARTSATALLSDGTMITRQPMPDGNQPCDISHDNGHANDAYDGGAMDGFDRESWSCSGSYPHLPFRYYTEQQLPNYWAYARNFVLADEFFSTLKGPTSPGHLAIVAAETPFFGDTSSSEGCSVASPPMIDFAYNRQTCSVRGSVPACFNIPSVVDHFPADHTWRAYGPVGSNGHVLTPFNFIQSVGGDAAVRKAHFRSLSKLLSDLRAGDQADLVFADVYSGLYTGLPGEAGDPKHHDNSEHPPANPCWGEDYTVMLVNAIMNGPRWKETAILITWDDYGGYYDHVAPKRGVCDRFNPGFRLPLLIISPYARKGMVLHKDWQGLAQEQASIPKLIEDVFGLPRMQRAYQYARDGQAGSLLGAFDFTQAPRPPFILQPRTCTP